MEIAVYAAEAAREQDHWWFVGRRRLFATEMRRAGISKNAAVLDVGTGTGSNLRMLRDLGYTRVTGLDQSDEAIRFCALKGLGGVRKGDICAMPFPDASFDFVLATDVIEHIDDDRAAAAEIVRVLRPGGRALITVPAFQSLWGLQDRQSHHKRRYRRRRLCEVLRAGGMQIERSYYFNYLLFAPIWLARQAIDLFGVRVESENQINSPLVNHILAAVFACDISTAPFLHPPFGVSILAVAKK